MMIKLYAINIVDGRFAFKNVPAPLKPKVKEQIILMVGEDNVELLNQLLAEKQG